MDHTNTSASYFNGIGLYISSHVFNQNLQPSVHVLHEQVTGDVVSLPAICIDTPTPPLKIKAHTFKCTVRCLETVSRITVNWSRCNMTPSRLSELSSSPSYITILIPSQLSCQFFTVIIISFIIRGSKNVFCREIVQCIHTSEFTRAVYSYISCCNVTINDCKL